MNENNCRIQLDMSMIEAIMAIVEGNPGAARVAMEMIKNNERVDPLDVMGPWGPLLHIDMLRLYGPRLWVLYKDVCNENVINTLAVLRANQLGLLSEGDLNLAVDGEITIGVDDLRTRVREELQVGEF
jgi:hypothetical protein